MLKDYVFTDVLWVSTMFIVSLLFIIIVLERFNHKTFFNYLANYLIQKSFATPYFHLEGYMERYWLVPNVRAGSETDIGCGPVSFLKCPFAFILQKLGIAVRVHKILRSDDGRDFHNHPWNFISIILVNGYTEVTPSFNKNGFYTGEVKKDYKEGSILFRKSNSLHRLELKKQNYKESNFVYTLFITRQKRARTWGFLIHPEHLIPWYDYLEAKREDKVNRAND